MSNGSCVPMAVSGSHPKAMICLSLSDTITFFAIVGADSELVREDNSTALVEVPLVLSQ